MGCSIKSYQRKVPISTLQNANLIVQATNFVIENENSFHDIYRLGKLLGTGSFGEVRLCVHRETSIKRAVKIIRKDLLTSPKQRESLDNEIRILKSLDHPSIVRVYEYFEEVRRLYIVLEFCNGGELFEEIVKKGTISEELSAGIMKQIFQILEYLQSSGVVHRDLKPENILLEEKHDMMNIKLIDFGAAVVCDRQTRLESVAGTLYYMAPEVARGDYNYLCDMWSAGVIMFILISGHPPFEVKSQAELQGVVADLDQLMRKEPWPIVSQEAKDLLMSLLAVESQRISPTEALKDKWILKYGSRQTENKKIHKALDKLRNFKAQSLLKDAIKTYMTIQYISASDVKDLKEVFSILDKDNDGKISQDELVAEYTKIVGEKEAKKIAAAIMLEVDSDHNGFIEYSEFLRANVDSRKIISEANLKHAFRMFDTDHSGKISAEEIGRILEGEKIVDSYLWKQVIKEFDSNGDGEIDLEEFGMLLKTRSEQCSALSV
jgi:calcium-dependent protein kinase